MMREEAVSSPIEYLELDNPEDLHKLFCHFVGEQLAHQEEDINNIKGLLYEHYSLPNATDMLRDDDYWRMLFLQHSVYYAYFRSRHYLAAHNPITLSSLVKYSHINGEDCGEMGFHYGLDYLLDNGKLTIVDVSGKPIIRPIEKLGSNIDESFSDQRTKYISSIRTISKYLSRGESKTPYMRIDVDGHSKNYVCDALGFELIQHFMRKKSLLSALLDIRYQPDKHLTPKGFQNYYLAYHKLVSEINPNRLGKAPINSVFYESLKPGDRTLSEKDLAEMDLDHSSDNMIHYSLSDKTFLGIYIEELFHFERIDCLFQNILNTSLYFEYDEIKNELTSLVQCLNLSPIPASNYFISAIFDKLNYGRHEFKKGSNTYKEYLSNYIDLYTYCIDKLSKCILLRVGYEFYNQLCDYVKQRYTTYSEVAMRIKVYEILRKYLNSEIDVINNYFSELGILNEKIVSPSFPRETKTDYRKITEMLKDMKGYSPGMQYYIDLIDSFYNNTSPLSSEDIKNRSYVEMALLPFYYPSTRKLLWPSKKNLGLYESCIRTASNYICMSYSQVNNKNDGLSNQ